MKPEFRVSARIAKPSAEVFDAVVNPGNLSGYFTTLVGRAPTGRRRDGDLVGKGSSEVSVPGSRIGRHWDGANAAGGPAPYKTRIEMNFEPLKDEATLVTIAETGWSADIKGPRTSYINCEGWSQMLSCMKAFLEYGVSLRESYYQSEVRGKPALIPDDAQPNGNN